MNIAIVNILSLFYSSIKIKHDILKYIYYFLEL